MLCFPNIPSLSEHRLSEDPVIRTDAASEAAEGEGLLGKGIGEGVSLLRCYCDDRGLS